MRFDNFDVLAAVDARQIFFRQVILSEFEKVLEQPKARSGNGQCSGFIL